jgi:hypothetical protein
VKPLEEDHYEIGILRRIVRVPQMDELGEFLAEQWTNNFFHIGKTTYTVLEIDVHYNVLREIGALRMWNRPRVVVRHGEEILALSAENLILLIALRCYLESMPTKVNSHPIHLFLDTLVVLVRFAAELNWDEVERHATQHKFLAPLYYVLKHANEVLGGKNIPGSYLNRWEPKSPGNDRSRDFGDFIPRLFDHLDFIPLEIA